MLSLEIRKRFRIVSEMFRKFVDPMPMYSTADIAKRLGCTPQALNKYRRKIERCNEKQLGRPDPHDGRRTLFSEDEVALIAELAPKVPVVASEETEWMEVELVDGHDVTLYKPIEQTALELRRTALPAVQRECFDLAAAEQETLEIEQHTTRMARRGDALLSDFAVGHMLAAAADIQRTIATMKANAMGDAVAQLGKPLAEDVDAN